MGNDRSGVRPRFSQAETKEATCFKSPNLNSADQGPRSSSLRSGQVDEGLQEAGGGGENSRLN
ncbi:MAG: hypothetical protein CL863_03190 [Cyanobium sp. RS427]|nr:hypothetical protein [Cyanobium sp. RS427]